MRRAVTNNAPGATQVKHQPVVKESAFPEGINLVDVDSFTARYAFLLYGDNGSGKTTIGKTAPNPLFITFTTENKGIISARGVAAKAIPIETWGQLEDAYWWLAKQRPFPFESIVLDTVTAMQYVCMARLLKLEAIKSKCPDSGDLMKEVFPAYMSQRHYGMLADAMRDMLLRFHELPCHLLMLAQKKDVQDDDSGRILETVPNMSPGVASTACNIANIIGYCYTKSAKGDKDPGGWFTYLAPHDRFKTKNQGGILPGAIQNFSVRDAINLIEKSGKGGK